MAEYIERQQVLDIVLYAMLGSCNQNFTLQRIHLLPAADVAPLVHGQWLPVDEKEDAFDCSECDAMVQKRHNFCPKCGAKMDTKD